MNRRSLLSLGASLVLAAGTVAASWGVATAQTPSAAPIPVVAPAASDTVSVWTMQWENASISTAKLRDRYYTNGLRLGWTSSPSLVPEMLKGMGAALWGAGEARLSVDLTHQLYNPADTSSGNPPLRDRPFGGVLMANFGLVQDAPTTRSTLVVGLGLVGPGAGGETVQNGFHDLIGQGAVRGWSTQLRNEALLQVTSERTWRVKLGVFGGVEADVLPSLTASAGNLRIYLQTGATIRIGQGLQADFGPARPRPGTTGGDYFRTVRPFAWYAFLGLDGRAVARDLLLDGNTWERSRSAKKYPFVGEAQGGLALIAYGVRLSYTHRLSSAEFRGQKGGLHQMGSLALSVRF